MIAQKAIWASFLSDFWIAKIFMFGLFIFKKMKIPKITLPQFGKIGTRIINSIVYQTPVKPYKYSTDQKLIQRIMDSNELASRAEVVSILSNTCSFFETNFINQYEGLNEIIWGKKPDDIKRLTGIFEQETGVKFFADNDTEMRALVEYLSCAKDFIKSNRKKGYSAPKEIYMTRLLQKGGGGYCYDKDKIFILSDYDEDLNKLRTWIRNILVHEDAHRRDFEYNGNTFTRTPEKFFQFHLLQKRRVLKFTDDKYMVKDLHEFVACFNEQVAKGNLHVCLNENSEKVLRKYITPDDKKIKARDIKILATLYKDCKGPIIPTEPVSKNLPYVEARFD